MLPFLQSSILKIIPYMLLHILAHLITLIWKFMLIQLEVITSTYSTQPTDFECVPLLQFIEESEA